MAFTKVTLEPVLKKAEVLGPHRMEFMSVNGRIILCTAKASSSTLTNIYMTVNGNLVNMMAMVGWFNQ